MTDVIQCAAIRISGYCRIAAIKGDFTSASACALRVMLDNHILGGNAMSYYRTDEAPTPQVEPVPAAETPAAEAAPPKPRKPAAKKPAARKPAAKKPAAKKPAAKAKKPVKKASAKKPARK